MDVLNKPAAAEQDGMALPQRGWAILTIIIGLIMAVLDATVANVALPTIARDFHTSAAAAVEIVSAYQLIIVLLLLPLSALGDIYGYRRVYLGGVFIFTLASLACALSDSLATLIAARVLQGIGAAGIMSVNTALLRFIVPQDRLGRAIGIIALTVALSSTIGPSFASVVLGIASWNWLFAVNVPVGVVVVVMGWRALPATPRSGAKFDALSAVLTAAMFGLLITAIDSLAHGASWPVVGAQIGVGLIAAVWAVRRQRRMRHPLLPVDLLRIPIFALSIATSICAFVAQMLAFVALPFFLETRLGFRATTIGFLIMPWPLAICVAAPLAGRLADRYPAGLLGLIGLFLLALGLAALALLGQHPSVPDICWRMALCGAGFGLFQPPNNRVMVSSAPRPRSGAASGMLSTARLLGQAAGAALLALILMHFPAQGAVVALWMGAGFALAAAGISTLRMV